MKGGWENDLRLSARFFDEMGRLFAVRAGFGIMLTMEKLTRLEFEKIVEQGIEAIPEKFLRKLENVAIIVEDEPTLAQKKKLNIRPNWTLFGLYEGVPQLERGANYSAVLPDKITIFQNPIEAAAGDEKDVKEIVKNTVWHEIAHHFGMDEAKVRQTEIRRNKKM